jgi:hypothetical protein
MSNIFYIISVYWKKLCVKCFLHIFSEIKKQLKLYFSVETGDIYWISHCVNGFLVDFAKLCGFMDVGTIG